MPIIKSAIKRARQQEKRRNRNVMIKTGVRIKLKSARSAIASDPKEAQAALVAAISEIDRAVKKGTLHKNTAARKKSRLTKAYNAAADRPFGTDKGNSSAKKPTAKSATAKSSATKKPAAKKSPAKSTTKKPVEKKTSPKK